MESKTGKVQSNFELRYEDENIWLSQKMMTELYGVKTATINEHIKKIYEDNELEDNATIRKFRIVQLLMVITMLNVMRFVMVLLLHAIG